MKKSKSYSEEHPNPWYHSRADLIWPVGPLVVLLYYTLRTVNKLRSLNLLFSCVFCIGRKTVHVGA
jgi:hypothetical protein